MSRTVNFPKGKQCVTFSSLVSRMESKHCLCKPLLRSRFGKLTTFFVVKEAHFDQLGFPVTSVLGVLVPGEILHS